MFICQNSEGVHPYLLKCRGGTCSFVGMLKGYIVRKRLGTPGLWHRAGLLKLCVFGVTKPIGLTNQMQQFLVNLQEN